MENENENQVGELYVVGTRGYSAYEIAVQEGFEGTEEEWLESLKGETGDTGPQGEQGIQGVPGPAPSLRVGSVATGEAGTNVEVSITGTPQVPLLNFTIPKGDKGDPGDTPELTDYVKNTDYAITSKGGVIKSGYNGLQVNSSTGKVYCDVYNYDTYVGIDNQRFISKGTLENVIIGKDLTTKAYVDGLVGNINTLLDTINGEVI